MKELLIKLDNHAQKDLSIPVHAQTEWRALDGVLGAWGGGSESKTEKHCWQEGHEEGHGDGDACRVVLELGKRIVVGDGELERDVLAFFKTTMPELVARRGLVLRFGEVEVVV